MANEGVAATFRRMALYRMPADSGRMSICYEISNYMLNINIYGNLSGMSISAKIRMLGFQPG